MYGPLFRAATRHNTSCSDNKENIKISYFKDSENIQKKECGLDRSVSDNQSSSVSLNELAMKASAINLNYVQIILNCLEYMKLNLYYFLISKNISADLKSPKVKYKLHYGRCTGPLFRATF